MEEKNPSIKIFVLPGGLLPKRQTAGAIGYDVHLRAILSANEMDSQNPILRKTLFDFQNIPGDKEIARHIRKEKDGLVYAMDPGESVLVGVGFTAEMPFPMFYWMAPRSGLSSKYGITVTNAPGTVDPDYRGEAGVLIYNRNNYSFPLRQNMRIAQIIFQLAIIPAIEIAQSWNDLSNTSRGIGGFGSTGT